MAALTEFVTQVPVEFVCDTFYAWPNWRLQTLFIDAIDPLNLTLPLVTLDLCHTSRLLAVIRKTD